MFDTSKTYGRKKRTERIIFDRNEANNRRKMAAKKYVTNFLDNSVLDSLLEGFQLIDFEWRYRYLNATVAKQGKSTKEALLGRTMMEMYPGIEQTEMFARLTRCMRERLPDRLENEFHFPDGSTAWFELRIEPVPEGLFILSIDITERKKAEEALRLLNESLESEVAKRTSELQVINREITDSIRYACRIQNARLPDKTSIFQALPQSFILYKPKAIVSGDFYFFHKNHRSLFIASADCTGHGVPGALLSMLCAEKLETLIGQHPQLSEIFRRLNAEIKSTLHQTPDEDSTKDGMDIALCAIDPNQFVLRFCGANRPLWIIRKGSDAVEEIKGTRKAMGGFTEDDQDFATHEVKLNKGDTFYIFSDGYADMMGGPDGKKLTSKRFKNLLLSIQGKSMGEQEKYLDAFAEKWREGIEQIDDILVIGVRV
jgi:PAS domain S-box-containing protein